VFFQRHNKRQRKGPKSAKFIVMETCITTPDLGQVDHRCDAQGHAQALMSTAIKSYNDLRDGDGHVAKALVWVLHTVGRFSRAVDVFVQCDPTIACLVWGSVRVLLQVCILALLLRKPHGEWVEIELNAICYLDRGG